MMTMSTEKSQRVAVSPAEALSQVQADLLIVNDNTKRILEKTRRISQIVTELQQVMANSTPLTRTEGTTPTVQEIKEAEDFIKKQAKK